MSADSVMLRSDAITGGRVLQRDGVRHGSEFKTVRKRGARQAPDIGEHHGHLRSACAPTGPAAQELVTTCGSLEDVNDPPPSARDLCDESVVTGVVACEQTDQRNSTHTRRDQHDRLTVQLVALAPDERVAVNLDRGLDHRRKITGREIAYDVGSTTLVTTQRCLPILRSRTNPSFS